LTPGFSITTAGGPSTINSPKFEHHQPVGNGQERVQHVFDPDDGDAGSADAPDQGDQ
jgi:hypothetical protein